MKDMGPSGPRRNEMNKNSTPVVSAINLAVILAIFFAPVVRAQDEWHYGIGTGVFALNLEGDAGVGTLLGPAMVDLSLDTSEITDLLESAIGIGGYAAKGKWVLLYSYQQMELEAGVQRATQAGTPGSALVNFTGSGAELAATYRFAVKGKNAWSALFGARYIKHELLFDLDIGANAFTREIDQDWTDALVGFTHAHPFSKKWTWTNRLDFGFGGSEGTVSFNSGFQWQPARHFAMVIFAKGTAVDFENGNPSDADWYLYDIDEFGIGLNFLYTR